MDLNSAVCPACHQLVQPEWYFCPNCGKDLKPKPVNVSAWAQIGVYALSVFLPPLGLWPGIKYLQKPGPQAKIVGWVAIILTIVSTVLTFWFTIHYLQNSINSYNGILKNSGGLNGLY
jgi:hypothetical protein